MSLVITDGDDDNDGDGADGNVDGGASTRLVWRATRGGWREAAKLIIP